LSSVLWWVSWWVYGCNVVTNRYLSMNYLIKGFPLSCR
jgi:hypothetical protein